KKLIWIARPSHGPNTSDEIIPVDWDALSRCACSAKNYQIFPGDRVYVAAQPLIAFNNALAAILQPLETLSGFLLLGQSTVTALRTGTSGQVFGTGINGPIVGVPVTGTTLR